MNRVRDSLMLVGFWLSLTIVGYAQNQPHHHREELPTDLNADYKHTMPTAPSTVKKNYDNVVKDTNTINQNYKQQNQPVRKVRFKDHFHNNRKRTRESYKHPKGL